MRLLALSALETEARPDGETTSCGGGEGRPSYMARGGSEMYEGREVDAS